MKIIIGICFILLMCSARGRSEVCRATDRGIDICETPTTIITHVRKGDLSLSDNGKSLGMKFGRDTIISPNAFSTLDPTSVLLEMLYTTERNKSALHTLTLHPDSFVGLSNASLILIKHANINLWGKTLTSITNLKRFRFMYCGFTEVPTEMLESTPNLIELSLESNYMRIIRPNAFALLKSLKEIYLMDNGIISLELGCFNGLDNLKVLRISNNHFRAVPSIFYGLTKLIHLNIDNAFDDNGFNPDILQNVPAVTSLEIGHNNITSLKSDMFDSVSQLAFVTLWKNRITNIPKGVFDKLKSLMFVDLSRNDIETIAPGAFSGLDIYSLHLLDNEMDKIIETGTFSNLTTKYLYLRNNNITELKPRAFDGLSAEKMDLTKNILKQIGAEDFFGLEIEKLDLSDNKIKRIAPNAFKNTKVKQLHLAENPIDMRDKGNWGLPETTKIV